MSGKSSNTVLFLKRKELQMTQQQVADKAGVQLRQYQRLEKGNRDIANASGKIMLSICKALKIDPYSFVGKETDKPEKKYVLFEPIVEWRDQKFIPCLSYYTLVSAIPRGMVCTGDAIMKKMRDAYGVQSLEIKTDLNCVEMHTDDCFPYWRVVAEDGYLVHSPFCSKEKQKEKLEQEGIVVTQINDMGLCVDDFSFCEFDLNNVSVTVHDTSATRE